MDSLSSSDPSETKLTGPVGKGLFSHWENRSGASNGFFDRKGICPAPTSKPILCFFCLLLFVLTRIPSLAAAIPVPPQTEKVPVSFLLEKNAIVESFPQGESFERTLSGSQTHTYFQELAAGQFIRIDLYSFAIDLRVSVIWSDGLKAEDWNVPKREPVPISWVTDQSGLYRLEVQSADCPQDSGLYRITTTARRQAATLDELQVAACRALSEGVTLRRQWTQESLQNAICSYERALELWQTTGDLRQEAAALRNIGDLWEVLSKLDKALSFLMRSRTLCRELEDALGELKSLNSIAASYIYKGEYKKALTFGEQAAELAEGVGDSWEKAQALHVLGATYYGINDMQKAKEFLNDALNSRQALRDRHGEAETLRYLGYVYHAQKDTRQAKSFYEQSLQICIENPNPRDQALVLVALGHLSNISGDRQTALGYYAQSNSIFEIIGEEEGQLTALVGIAYVYSAMGEKQKALHHYSQALDLAQRLKDKSLEAVILDDTSEIYRSLGEYERAIQFSQKAVRVNQAMPSTLGESYALSNLGKALEAVGKKEAALNGYNRGLGLARQAGDRFLEGLLFNAIGHVYYGMGDSHKAIEYYQQALNLQEASQDFVREPSTLYNFARAERDLGNWESAIAYSNKSLKIIESLRANVCRQDLRSSFLASIYDQYTLAIDLQMQMHQRNPTGGFAARAFETSERSRARTLLESLVEARAGINEGVDPALLQRQTELQRLLHVKAEEQMHLSNHKSHNPVAEALVKEIRELTFQHEELLGEIRAKSSRYAALIQPEPLSLEEIQTEVLDDESLLLEYALGEDRSYLWAVTKGGISSYLLPKRKTIESTARKVYASLLGCQGQLPITDPSSKTRFQGRDGPFWANMTLLSQLLLAPVASQLFKSRIVVVTEGALQYIPFGALPEPRASWKDIAETGIRSSTASATELPPPLVPLILKHEVIHLTSASTLAVLRKQIAHRQPGNRTIALLADPVYEATDPRVGKLGSPSLSSIPSHLIAESISASDTSVLDRALRDVGFVRDGLSVPRLYGSRDEADGIFSVIPAETGLKILDFKASRYTVMNSDLTQFRIIHFATHGILSNEHPELSGLVLSLVDEHGRPQDGFLRLHDIYKLNLPAELIVLSACNTGLGKEIKGEGLVGIVRGFMYAGAARVVSSLWKVDDEATAELMKRFYTLMFRDKMTASAALRLAQVEMWRQAKWHSPYYWAGFVLQGEWQ